MKFSLKTRKQLQVLLSFLFQSEGGKTRIRTRNLSRSLNFFRDLDSKNESFYSRFKARADAKKESVKGNSLYIDTLLFY